MDSAQPLGQTSNSLGLTLETLWNPVWAIRELWTFRLRHICRNLIWIKHLSNVVWIPFGKITFLVVFLLSCLPKINLWWLRTILKKGFRLVDWTTVSSSGALLIQETQARVFQSPAPSSSSAEALKMTQALEPGVLGQQNIENRQGRQPTDTAEPCWLDYLNGQRAKSITHLSLKNW